LLLASRARSLPRGRYNRRPALEENSMRDVIFIVLTLVIFAVFALIAKGVERM
jgi:hypothetical protein